MDCQNYITKNQNASEDSIYKERGAIQRLKRLGYSNRAIVREIGCSPDYRW